MHNNENTDDVQRCQQTIIYFYNVEEHMLVITMEKDDRNFYSNLCKNFPDEIFFISQRSFLGDRDIYELVISLTPPILASITIILHDILRYKKSKQNKTKFSISLKKDDHITVIIDNFDISSANEIDKIVKNAVSNISIFVNENE